MTIVIGTDEAGYGPKLGPLVISATAWKLSEKLSWTDLYQSLSSVITDSYQKSRSTPSRLCVADSKKIYQRKRGLTPLAQNLLPFVEYLYGPDSLYSLLTDDLSHPSTAQLLPDVDFARVSQAKKSLDNIFKKTNIRLLAIRSRLIEPPEFNSLLNHYGNKATLLSVETLSLAKKILSDNPPPACTVLLCDKHGGRAHYAPLLQQIFEVPLVEPLVESQKTSRYRLTFNHSQKMEAHFSQSGESALPVALASIASKLFRELAMKAFNSYWIQKLPHLLPTAGYPQDAKRFFAEIEPTMLADKIPHETIWRKR
ncbi:MAG: hypothetical protein MPJ24_06115 [Pirellulaceae bacterium]|nr:hypothetical protein [Pirellulaceae bacterium]